MNIRKKKRVFLYKRLVGIKNSWKYEKDLIIFKPYYIPDTITHLSILDIEFRNFSDKLFKNSLNKEIKIES